MPSPDTGAYSKARIRLPEGVVKRLLHQSGQSLEEKLKEEQLWCGRKVRICDGSTVTMSDTKANQALYPQPTNQAPGCGFPITKIVVMFSLLTGALLEVVNAKLNSADVVLARKLYHTLNSGDVLLADSAFGTYVDLALIREQQADGVFRKHHQRKTDFRRGKKLGIGDHIVFWQRPQKCPNGMSKKEFLALPEQIQVREVHILILQPGFRPKEIILVTTLLDPKRYTKASLAQLYQLRWQVEVDIKHIKTTLGMEMILAKTPAMVRKEIWVHLLAYNLLRALMLQAGQQLNVSPERISLQGARQYLNSFASELARTSSSNRSSLYRTLLMNIAYKLVPLRPNRAEPRLKKRRPNHYKLLQQPRNILKTKLAA